MDKSNDIRLVQLASYVRPNVVENKFKKWVLNDRWNSFYGYVIDRFNGSPTNNAIISSYIDLIIGRGLYDKNDSPDFEKFAEMLSKNDFRRIVTDFAMFTESSIQIVYKRNKKELPTLKHVPKEKIAPEIADKDNIIHNYWYCEDWKREMQNPAVQYPAFTGKKNGDIEIYVVKPYNAGKKYFADPSYLACLPYAEMEEEIANLYINSIKNGLSAGYIINIPDGVNLTSEQKDELELKIKKKLTGSPNASRFILSFNGRDAEVTIFPIPQNENVHKQWSFLTEEAKRQLITGHRLTSPTLAGLSTASGFSSTADEMDMAEKQLMKRVIQPKQRYLLDAFEEIATSFGLELELDILPLTVEEDQTEQQITEKKDDESELDNENVKMSKEVPIGLADDLISKGEEISDEWEMIDERDCSEMTLSEDQLNTVFKFASIPKTSSKKSNQDTSLFKIRYQYAGLPNPEREFCQKVMASNKVFRAEDLDGNYTYNEKLSPKGQNGYNIFLYKGGANCKHWWQRVIFLRKNNDRISVNEAKRMILQLEPNERKDAKWKENPKEVAKMPYDLPNHGYKNPR